MATYTQCAILPKRTKEALIRSPRVPNISKTLRDIMLRYAGNKESTFALLVRHMQRKMLSGHTSKVQEEMCKTTISSDQDLYRKFVETAHLFDQSYDFLLKVAVEDFLINEVTTHHLGA